VLLYPQAGWEWPFAETHSHWIALGTHADLNEAFKIALRKCATRWISWSARAD
jgi:hypothetical protein